MKRSILFGLSLVVYILLSVRVQAQIPVIDSANLVQNITQVAKALTMIANQVRQIEIAFEQLQDMLKNSTPTAGIWAQALPLLDRLGRNIEQARALAYTLRQLDAEFRRRYPGFVPPRDWAAEYELWTSTVLDTLRNTLTSVQIQSDAFLSEDQRLEAITAKSESAIGRLQAIQAGNMIAAENTRHLMKLRQLVMMQIDAQNTFMATEANKESQVDAFTREWLLNATKPYPPELRQRLQQTPGR